MPNIPGFFIRSFKGNRKRPRTETAEGASGVEGKKLDKEEKDVNGDNKESPSKDSTKEPEKKGTEVGTKSTAESLNATEESKGHYQIYSIQIMI